MGKSDYRYVWYAAEMKAKNEEWQMVCANVFSLEWSQRLRAMMDVRSLSSLSACLYGILVLLVGNGSRCVFVAMLLPTVPGYFLAWGSTRRHMRFV
jgi:hypothetical protein